MKEILDTAKEKMGKCVNALESELQTFLDEEDYVFFRA